MKIIKNSVKAVTAQISKISKFYSSLHQTIRYRFTTFTILIVLIPLSLVGIYFYVNISNNLKSNANKYLSHFAKSITDSIESQFRIIDNTSMVFLSNPTLRYVLEDSTSDSQYLRTQKATEMDYQLKYLLFFNYAWDSKLINSVFVFKDESTFYYIIRDTEQQKHINANIDVFKQSPGNAGEKTLISPSENDPTIYFVCNINDLNTLKHTGKLVFAINESKLYNIEQTDVQYANAQILTFDNKGIIFSHTQKGLLGKKVDEAFYTIKDSEGIAEVVTKQGTYFAVAKKINNKYGLTSIVAVPKNEVLSNLSTSMTQYTEIIVLVAFFSLVIGLFASTQMTNPLRKLMKNIKAVESGRYDMKMPAYKYLEFNELSSVFNTMTDEIDYLINEVYEKQLLIKEADLKSLQSQVNPHFLFNTLEAISWHARMSGNETIYKMVTSLGHLLRANIRPDNGEKITIREELQYMEFYLDLQKMRFEDRLIAEITVSDEEILSYKLPRLCIQPIIENAIIHGLEEKRGKGILKIQVWEEKHEVYFCVIDNGIGFNVEDIHLDDSNYVLMRKEGHTSIGLHNSNKRIKLLYGNNYGISIQSKPGEGTKVTVCLPIDKEDGEDVSNNDCGR